MTSAVSDGLPEQFDASGAPTLEVSHITAGYGRSTVLADVSLTIRQGSAVALLGPNGAGKTSLLRVIAGQLAPRAGSVSLAGFDITKLAPNARSRRGLCLIPEGRGIFRSLSVRDNLNLLVPPWVENKDLSVVLDAFPVLAARFKQTAGSLSGGEQQMLALARAFLAEPRIILVDEASMGLAPVLVDAVFEILDRLMTIGAAVVIVEQYVHRALAFADHAYLMLQGAIVFDGPASLLDPETVARTYVG